MKKTIGCLLLVLLLGAGLPAQQNPPLVEAFQRNYTRGSLSTKIEVLQDSMNYPDSDMSPLYLQSLDFVTRNAPRLGNDNLARELAALTIRLLGTAGVSDSAAALWQFFEVYEDVPVRREILSTLGEIAPDDREIIALLNRWVDGRNNLYRAGQPVELELLGEAFTALGKMGDESSFPVLFTSVIMDYPEELRQKAEDALHQVSGDYRRMVTAILQGSPLQEKLYVLRFVVKETNITGPDKAWIAASALKMALDLTPRNAQEQEMVFQLQDVSVQILMDDPVPEAARELIRHFDTALLAWDREMVPLDYLLRAIDALGRSGTHEAAERLTLYLELLNLYTENGQAVQDQVVSGVIRNLGMLGDKISFDYLLYVRYLNYPEEIKRAAREALDKLKRE